MFLQFIEKFWKLLVAIIFIMSFAIPLRFYYLEFGQYPRSYEHEAWGQFGDFIGGVFNPIIGIMNIVIIMLALFKQIETNKELRDNQLYIEMQFLYQDRVRQIESLCLLIEEEINEFQYHGHVGKNGILQFAKDCSRNAELISTIQYHSYINLMDLMMKSLELTKVNQNEQNIFKSVRMTSIPQLESYKILIYNKGIRFLYPTIEKIINSINPEDEINNEEFILKLKSIYNEFKKNHR